MKKLYIQRMNSTTEVRPFETVLLLTPRRRFETIDVRARIAELFGDVLQGFQRILYCSHHTTAGYLDQRIAHRLHYRSDRVDPYIDFFRGLFPRGAGYRHDEMDQRSELTEDERMDEPPNGDAHLTYIGSGLSSCVTYDATVPSPVFFMELDGVYRGIPRQRRTSVIAYNRETVVSEEMVEIPVSQHAIDSVNLGDERFGLQQRIEELLRSHSIENGRLDVALDPNESAAGVTVNEFETLLMRHDLAEVLQNPLRFAARQGRRALADPRSVPAKSLGYARYDVVRIINRLLDATGTSDSIFEAMLTRVLAITASRRLRFKRSLSMPVSAGENGRAQIVIGRYQTPILIQWAAPSRRSRRLRLRLSRFE